MVIAHGCRDGRGGALPAWLADHTDAQVLGVDLSDSQLAHARRLLADGKRPNLRFVQQDVMRLLRPLRTAVRRCHLPRRRLLPTGPAGGAARDRNPAATRRATTAGRLVSRRPDHRAATRIDPRAAVPLLGDRRPGDYCGTTDRPRPAAVPRHPRECALTGTIGRGRDGGIAQRGVVEVENSRDRPTFPAHVVRSEIACTNSRGASRSTTITAFTASTAADRATADNLGSSADSTTAGHCGPPRSRLIGAARRPGVSERITGSSGRLRAPHWSEVGVRRRR